MKTQTYTTITGVKMTANQMKAILAGVKSSLVQNRKGNRDLAAWLKRYGITKEIATEAGVLAWYEDCEKVSDTATKSC